MWNTIVGWVESSGFFGGLLLLAVAGPLGALLAWWLVRRAGRRRMEQLERLARMLSTEDSVTSVDPERRRRLQAERAARVRHAARGGLLRRR